MNAGIAATLATSLFAAAASATTYGDVHLGDLIDNSDAIIVGSVVSLSVNDSKRAGVYAVTDVLKGEAAIRPSDRVAVSYEGLQDLTLPTDVATYWLLFLKKEEAGWRVLSEMGALRVAFKGAPAPSPGSRASTPGARPVARRDGRVLPLVVWPTFHVVVPPELISETVVTLEPWSPETKTVRVLALKDLARFILSRGAQPPTTPR